MKKSSIEIVDISSVAEKLGFTITQQQMLEVQERYPSAQREDPTATWNLVVENLIYEIHPK